MNATDETVVPIILLYKRFPDANRIANFHVDLPNDIFVTERDMVFKVNLDSPVVFKRAFNRGFPVTAEDFV
jgi:hypothetical protein